MQQDTNMMLLLTSQADCKNGFQGVTLTEEQAAVHSSL
jgi:hypothetical protein